MVNNTLGSLKFLGCHQFISCFRKKLTLDPSNRMVGKNGSVILCTKHFRVSDRQEQAQVLKESPQKCVVRTVLWNCPCVRGKFFVNPAPTFCSSFRRDKFPVFLCGDWQFEVKHFFSCTAGKLSGTCLSEVEPVLPSNCGDFVFCESSQRAVDSGEPGTPSLTGLFQYFSVNVQTPTRGRTQIETQCLMMFVKQVWFHCQFEPNMSSFTGTKSASLVGSQLQKNCILDSVERGGPTVSFVATAQRVLSQRTGSFVRFA